MVRVGVGYSTQGWRTALTDYATTFVDDVTVVTLRDPSTIAESAIDVLLVDQASVLFTPDVVRRAAAARVPVVGVTERWDDEIDAAFTRLNITRVVGATGLPPPVVLLEELRRFQLFPDDMTVMSPASPASTGGLSRGALVAVGGPAGAGRTELAARIALGFAGRGRSVLLVDVNEADPHVAVRLGLAPTPNLVSLVDSARAGKGVGIVEHLARHAVGARNVALGFDVLAGMASGRDWQQVRTNELAVVLDAARAGWDVVVAVTAPLLETSRSIDRWALSRLVLADASAVVGVCTPSPSSVTLLLSWLADAVRVTSAPVDVVVNQTRDRWRANETEARIVDDGGVWVRAVHPVPFDTTIAAADWDGSLHASRRAASAVGRLVSVLSGSVQSLVAVR